MVMNSVIGLTTNNGINEREVKWSNAPYKITRIQVPILSSPANYYLIVFINNNWTTLFFYLICVFLDNRHKNR